MSTRPDNTSILSLSHNNIPNFERSKFLTARLGKEMLYVTDVAIDGEYLSEMLEFLKNSGYSAILEEVEEFLLFSSPHGHVELYPHHAYNEDADAHNGVLETIDLYIASTQREEVTYFKKLSEKKAEKPAAIKMLVRYETGLEFRSVSKINTAFEPLNYTPDVQEAFNLIGESISDKEPDGRLSILEGPPGTGKTHFVKAIITANPKANYCFIPSNMVGGLAEPSFVSLLLDIRSVSKPTVLVIEDADVALTSRDESNMSILSTLLNLTDGMMGDALNIRVLATTNAKVSQLDSAVLRPGRLLSKLHLGKLPKAQAQEVYRRITGSPDATLITKDMVLGEIYALADDAPVKELVEKKTNKIGF